LTNLVPSTTQAIRLTGDMFDAGEGNNDHRTTIAIRNDTVNRGEFGVNGYNFVELGLYNANAEDKTQPPGVSIPATGFAYRLTLFGGLVQPQPEPALLRQPDWQYFPLDPTLDKDGNGLVNQIDVNEIADENQFERWHTYSATIGVDFVTVSLDLFRDGLNNATGAPGVDSQVTWAIFPHNDPTEPNPFDPFNSLRIGGPSGSASAKEAVVDNIEVELVDIAMPPANNADFNNDGLVDGADFLIWQRGQGLAGQVDKTHGDANGDGSVNAADLAVWQTQFVNPPAAAAVTGVPEPASVLLTAVALLGVAAMRRR
jgi:hypothetical protein